MGRMEENKMREVGRKEEGMERNRMYVGLYTIISLLCA